MFSTKEYISKKTGPYGVGRLSFLQELVDEFQSTDSEGIESFVVRPPLSTFMMERLPYQYGTHYLTMYLHTYRCIVDFF